MKIHFKVVVMAVFLCSCNEENRIYTHTLQPVDSYLDYELDSDVKVPMTVRTCRSDKEYLYFQNGIWPELVIYDLENGELIRKIGFEKEGGNHAIKGGFLYGFMMTDCNQIFISDMAEGNLYITDTTGCVRRKMDFKDSDYKPLPSIHNNGSFQLIDGKLHLPQMMNFRLGTEHLDESILLCRVDTISGKAEAVPVRFPQKLFEEPIVRGTTSTIVIEYKSCFDGTNFIFSFGYMDELLVANPVTGAFEYKPGNSQYIGKVRKPVFNNSDERAIQRKICESPSYGDILYDPQHKVYYRIAYVPQSIEKEVDPLSVIRHGKKQFSVVIFDEKFNIIGEYLFPEYTYNSKLCFVLGGKLYVSTNHFKNPDYSDDILRFQAFELKELNKRIK